MTRTCRIETLAAFVVAVVVPALAWASPAAEGGHGGGHGGEHAGGHLEWLTPVFGHTGSLGLVWILINFAVLMWILNKILFQPLINRTRDKHDAVKSEIDKATAAREEAESVLSEYKERLDRLDDEIAELMADAKRKAEADRKRILEAAEHEAEQIKAAAKAAAEREAGARRRQLEAEIVDRAVERAEALIRQGITPADQRGMVDRYVEQLGRVDFQGR
ncbi:MAG: ATP synthase F0 subunit B [Myxococcales bacterium]|nr:ATP synthase F0 subunit B [Myxococcales bacterium]